MTQLLIDRGADLSLRAKLPGHTNAPARSLNARHWVMRCGSRKRAPTTEGRWRCYESEWLPSECQ